MPAHRRSDPPKKSRTSESNATKQEQRSGSADDQSQLKSDIPAVVPVVAIGASAGGLAAIKKLFEPFPAHCGMAFAVIQHLAPDHESQLADLLQSHVDLTVRTAEDGLKIRPDHIYVIPPNAELSIRDGRLRLDPLHEPRAQRMSVDVFFQSLAAERGPAAVGVVLSGTGTDGSVGLKAIREAGGLTMAQDPADADYDGMPRSALRTGMVDVVLPAGELGMRLLEIGGDAERFPRQVPEQAISPEDSSTIDAILSRLRTETGTDFTQYKKATIHRRLARRMQIHRLTNIEEYFTFLQEHRNEVDALHQEFLISVTHFFRDPEVWEFLRDSIIPKLFEGKETVEEVRVWVPGCATGEEAFTIAMLLRDHARTLAAPPAIQVFATDVNPRVIEKARTALYVKQALAHLPQSLCQRYFYADSDGFRVSRELRNDVLFAVQNVLTDPPFSNLDLVSCRNLLIYLESEAQERLLRTFNYGLRDGGHLLLGTSEAVSAAPNLFKADSPAHHVYRALPANSSQATLPEPQWSEARWIERQAADLISGHATAPPADQPASSILHERALLEEYAPPSILVDSDYQLLHVFGNVSPYLVLSEGTPTRDSMDMLHTGLRPQLRAMLYRIFQEQLDTLSREFVISMQGDSRAEAVGVEVKRLETTDAAEHLASVTFRRLEASEADTPVVVDTDADDSPLILQLERELATTRERLQVTVEEYETANEELKASNEELLSMNEELQSTTEELETSREELQSMNEELTTVNEELNHKLVELDALNADLQNLMTATEIGTLFLDADLHVKRFTPPATEFVNLIPTDVGRPFEHVTHDLEGMALHEEAQRVLTRGEQIERETDTADGRHFIIRLLPYRTRRETIDGVVITFFEITRRKQAEQALMDSERRFRSLFESGSDAMFVYTLDDDGRPAAFTEVNAVATSLLRYTREQLRERSLPDIVDPDCFDLDGHLEELRARGCSRREAVLVDSRRERIPVEFNSRTFDNDRRVNVLEVARDISARKRFETALIDARDRAEELAEVRSRFLSTMSHEVRSPLSAILTYLEILKEEVGEEGREILGRVRIAGERVRDALDSVLRLAGLESGETEPQIQRFDLANSIRKSIAIHEEWADQKDLVLLARGLSEEVEAELDARFVVQILDNLLDNAIKYTDYGGIEVSLDSDDETVRIDVRDTGIGISEDQQDHIFEAYKRGEQAGSPLADGTGLGLAITRILVDAMDGEIELQSTVGAGSCFSIRLPRRLAPAENTPF